MLQISANILGFGSTIVLAQVLGKNNYDIYTYLFSWIALLGGISSLGLSSFIVREVARNKTKKQDGLIKGLLLSSSSIVLGTSILLGLAVYFWSNYIGNHPNITSSLFDVKILQNPSTLQLWIYALFAIPLLALTHIFRSALRGAKYIISSQLPAMLLKPVALLSMLGIAYYVYQPQALQLSNVIVINLISWALCLCLALYLFSYKMGPSLRVATSHYQWSYWSLSAVSFFFMSTVSLVNAQADVVMLGAMLGANEGNVGVYQIAVKLSQIPKTLLIVVNAVIAPLIADFYARGEHKRLQNMLTKTARGVLILALPLLAVLMIFGHYFLYLWGEEFVMAHTTLIILCIAQFFNLAFGSVGNILLMTGYEKPVLIVLSITCIINILINYLLIPHLHINGAAIATGISLFIWNAMLAVFLVKQLGIDATVLGAFSKKQN